MTATFVVWLLFFTLAYTLYACIQILRWCLKYKEAKAAVKSEISHLRPSQIHEHWAKLKNEPELTVLMQERLDHYLSLESRRHIGIIVKYILRVVFAWILLGVISKIAYELTLG